MTRRDGWGQVARATATLLTFLSRADLLELRRRRSYNRYMMVAKGFVAADGPEQAGWQRESAEDCGRDAEWNRRHGPVAGGATILRWRHHEPEGEQQARQWPPTEATIR